MYTFQSLATIPTNHYGFTIVLTISIICLLLYFKYASDISLGSFVVANCICGAIIGIAYEVSYRL